METTKEQEGGLLHQILPPCLEDAGLEDCALPPDSIKDAFFKAATAVKSRAASFLSSDEDEDADGNCVNDPWPVAKDRADKVVGVCPEPEAPGPCGAKKGGGAVDVGGDEMVLRGDEEKEDKVVVGGVELGERGKACVEGLQGLEIEDKKLKNIGGNGGDEEEEEEEEDDEKPILVEGVV
ncbi:hypothetical protein FEM48_Zijuj01G0292700 [Ziziphus jujuba var. spinosa]|uniref:Uncharacterized protein n=1 Tax=Ziziphus jujuba var. spinosa TaxID=714518 RepID=A0A978W5P3_ZIZJJ|nr:hypothetical protein FEM48_Zijuj01G0292700 [Ziziphus jujuba var. spinosa]